MHQFFDARQVSISKNMGPLEPDADFPYLVHTVAYNNRY